MSYITLKTSTSFTSFCEENGVIPIHQDKLPVRRLAPKIQHNAASVNYQESSMLQFDDSFSEYFIDGQKSVIKDLRLGKYKVVACIDLHHHNQTSALDKLSHFIQSRTTKGSTCLKIIHGKGLNSSSGSGVLKHLVRRYLERNMRLLAYASAPNNQGGDGVTLVKLKSNL